MLIKDTVWTSRGQWDIGGSCAVIGVEIDIVGELNHKICKITRLLIWQQTELIKSRPKLSTFHFQPSTKQKVPAGSGNENCQAPK